VSGDGICLQIDLPGEGPMRLRVSSSSRMNFTGERGRSSSDRAARAAGGRSANREEGRSG